MQLIKNIKVSHCTNHASIKAPVADIKVFEVVWWLVHHFCTSFKNLFFKSWFWEIKGKIVFVEETLLLALKAKGFQVSSYPIFIDLQFNHSMARGNLNKSKKVLNSTTSASKYIPKRPIICISWNLKSPFQIHFFLVKVPLNVNIVKQDLLNKKQFLKTL